ncbi:hypothetical protein [Mycobacterium sp.]|uniref:hypothetical protein n=1 Tax=Mycobacterium sp. TaxID=1785 RepID=UPI003D0E5930
MYDRDAPAALAALIGTGQLPLTAFKVETFSLDDVSTAVDHAARHSGAFRLTVLLPNS